MSEEQEIFQPGKSANVTLSEAMPPKVATAVVAVMGAVPKLAKTEKNTHGSYNFASIDDFLEAVRPLCAKHGLIIAQDEESFETKEGKDAKGNTVLWLVVRFRFTLAHSSGETWAHKPCRTIMVNAKMGSQAFGAAQSYALKQYMRSLFQIATGEKGMDADEHPPADLPAGAKVWGSEAAAQAWRGPLNKTTLKDKMRDFAKDLKACEDPGMLAGLLESYKDIHLQCSKEPGMEEWWDKAAAAIGKKQQEMQQAEFNPLDAG